jgi:hypothetical protein
MKDKKYSMSGLDLTSVSNNNIPLLLFVGSKKENGFHHGEGLNGNSSFPAPT